MTQKQISQPVPQRCPFEPDDGGLCKSTKFLHVAEESDHTDFQTIRVQEQSQNLAMGALPQAITVLLTDDLADSCLPGGMDFRFLLFQVCSLSRVTGLCNSATWRRLHRPQANPEKGQRA